MDNAYILVLECQLPYEVSTGNESIIRYEDVAIEFDVVEDTQTTLSSDITTHPLVNGDTIADHMYRTPTSMSVSGNFSLQGNKRYAFYGESADRLTNIQTLFERIKNEAIFCRLLKRSQLADSDVRFVARNNMVLTNIVWTERQNSLGFQFNFEEAIVSNVQEFEYEVDPEDEYLPDINEPSSLSFVDTLLDREQVRQVVMDVLQDEGLVSNELLEWFVAAGKTTGIAVAGLAAGAAIVAAGVFLASNPIGWIVAGIAAAAVGIGLAVQAGINEAKKTAGENKYNIKAFGFNNSLDSESSRQAELKRFEDYVDSIVGKLDSLNDYIKLYQVAANVNQKSMIYIDNRYYSFSFAKNNTSQKWSMEVTDMTTSGNTARQDSIAAYNNIGDLSDGQPLFITENGFSVYVMNFEAGKAELMSASVEELQKKAEDLRNYTLLITSVDMKKFNQMLGELVRDAMLR